MDNDKSKCCFVCKKKSNEFIKEKNFAEMEIDLKRQYKGLIKCMFLQEWVCLDCFGDDYKRSPTWKNLDPTKVFKDFTKCLSGEI